MSNLFWVRQQSLRALETNFTAAVLINVYIFCLWVIIWSQEGVLLDLHDAEVFIVLLEHLQIIFEKALGEFTNENDQWSCGRFMNEQTAKV